ncbi:MAG TPA: AsmA-like C-terminal region-containing protein, partial [Luteolibacter sp.]|nr:AsmA-like C-terminal region-containing protein [Luteolibacter sp.]
SHHELDFYEGTVVFDHDDYALRRDFGGPRQTTARVGRVRYVSADKLVHVEDVAGDIWAAPLVRLFASKLADDLESYRFHRPPSLAGGGVVDVTPRGRTRLDVSFKSTAAADYRFLGKNLTLSRPAGMVRVSGPRVFVNDLRLNAFDGPLSAAFVRQENGRLKGEITWTKLDLAALTSTYGHEMKSGGLFTGRIEFGITGGKVETMNGEGLFALEKTELFSVPIFGPLSPLISGVLQDRRAGFERAKSAFCTFRVDQGVMRSNDFHTSTTSLNFAGEGEVDLAARTIDMTMRMNARGLLGLLTLPLRPFYGMFQFRGTGPLDEPVWENVMFSDPSPRQKELLSDPPKAKIVADPQ